MEPRKGRSLLTHGSDAPEGHSREGGTSRQPPALCARASVGKFLAASDPDQPPPLSTPRCTWHAPCQSSLHHDDGFPPARSPHGFRSVPASPLGACGLSRLFQPHPPPVIPWREESVRAGGPALISLASISPFPLTALGGDQGARTRSEWPAHTQWRTN